MTVTSAAFDSLSLESLVLITGLSGAGRSSAQRILSDLGYYAVDNLPLELLNEFLLFVDKNPRFKKVALHVDLATKADRDLFLDVFAKLKKLAAVTLLFIDCDTANLLKRYNETRRPHPGFEPVRDKTLEGTILRERKRYTPVGEIAHMRIDTSTLNIHQLKDKLTLFIDNLNIGTSHCLRVNFLSFGFKHGLPRNCDLVMDVRFINNPYFIERLREKTGLESDVKSFVLKQDVTISFFSRYLDLLNYLIPLYQAEGKAYINIGIGCTGGKHRSVVIAEELAKSILAKKILISTEHRDIGK